MPFEQDYGYTYEGTVQVGKFSVVKPSSTTYKDGFVLPAAKNDPVLGVLLDGIYPHGSADYAKGVYTGISGTAWPANAQPASPVGQKRSVRLFGRVQCIAAGACVRGNRAIIANNLGQVEDVDTDGAIAGGTAINVVGKFDTACSNAGDIVYVIADPHKETK
jgi:hypothetical protein